MNAELSPLVSIIRRCGGTCRRSPRQSGSLGSRKFQSSEDVGGHADPSGLPNKPPNRWFVSIIRRCGGTCRPVGTQKIFALREMFQSSEDVGGHADQVWGICVIAVAAMNVSIIRRCGGTCRRVLRKLVSRSIRQCFNHPKMWGDMPTQPTLFTLSKQESFNHPKMWGDMPTELEDKVREIVADSFNHPKMWGDMPTWSSCWWRW